MAGLIFLSLFIQCTWTIDSNKNVVLGSGCTAADIFVDAAHHDFRLVSPAIGNPAVGNALCFPEVTTDIDGVPRPNRAPGAIFPSDSACDIGAHQYVAPNPPPAAPTNLRIIGGLT